MDPGEPDREARKKELEARRKEREKKLQESSLKETRFYINLALKRNPERAMLFLTKYNDTFGSPVDYQDLLIYTNTYAVRTRVKLALAIPICSTAMYYGYNTKFQYNWKYKVAGGFVVGYIISELAARIVNYNLDIKLREIEQKYSHLEL